MLYLEPNRIAALMDIVEPTWRGLRSEQLEPNRPALRIDNDDALLLSSNSESAPERYPKALPTIENVDPYFATLRIDSMLPKQLHPKTDRYSEIRH
jgi:hypothetical protein